MEKIANDELVEIFNNVLNSSSFVPTIPIFGLIESPSHRDTGDMKNYYEEKQFDIERELVVFENIPKNKIYNVIEDFIHVLEKYNRAKKYKMKNSKKLQKDSYNLIQKDIKIIEKYQEIIFNYTSYYDYNYDEDYSILNPELDEIYEKNILFLEELKTKEFKILDGYRYGGTNLYDSTKKPIKRFFKKLQKEYTLKTLNIKQMIDIL